MRYKQIVDMARQAGAWPELSETPVKDVAFLTRFAELVRADEREACAKIVEESSLPDAYSEPYLLVIAEEIRARGQA